MKKYQDEGDKKLNIEVGRVKGLLDGKREHIRFQQTNLGRLIAQSQMERVKADIGIMNSGGIRTSLEEGVITYKHILTVQPFGNMIATVDLKGQELLDTLTTIALKEVDTGAYPQFAGISMVVDRTAKTISDVKIGGKPFDKEKTYKVSLPDYVAAGGDGYPLLKKHPSYVNTGFIDAEMLKKFFEENKIIEADKYDPKTRSFSNRAIENETHSGSLCSKELWLPVDCFLTFKCYRKSIKIPTKLIHHHMMKIKKPLAILCQKFLTFIG